MKKAVIEPITIKNGYINIVSSPKDTQYSGPNGTEVLIGKFNNLDSIINNNYLDELTFEPILNRLYPQDVISCLQNWISKLKIGGKLILNFFDIRTIGVKSFYESILLQDIHSIIYGQNYENKSLMDLLTIKTIAKELKLDINLITHDNVMTVIEFIKNENT